MIIASGSLCLLTYYGQGHTILGSFNQEEAGAGALSVVVKTMNRLQHQFYCLLGHAATRPDDGLMSLIILTAAPSTAALEHTPAQHIVCVLWHSVSNTDIGRVT